MSLIKCKMCGADLPLKEGQSITQCEYCGSVQTIPKVDDEKKLTLFARANRLRAACEFDKAAGIYEAIVADFPEEAEAYWGLVLCKYGIEYVDDPATGKKIPTCHRSSFDSVLEDSDFEQALENADGAARKVYREEAKAIEELRKGIIAVSANEEPYDIFICYKETDEKGERTLDSVLAQDVYDALTDKGYRVFFSRITLEDKLGQEYEPYIFAALNSAKVMLAFGTDYEYFNAVWVKNEWSRFLKLMARDKNRHLIPCFKGIDAYDMPKEFAKLQAQDLGKVGATQDLLRGIEKLLPRQQSIAKETVVVKQTGGADTAPLLKRVFLFLEDSDWRSADEYCEKVLDLDPECAQAYLCKTLAQEKCRNLGAFIQKRRDASMNVRGETLTLKPDQAHVDRMVQKCAIDGYVTEKEIRKLYEFDLRYHSEVVDREYECEREKTYWATHKLLSKAEKYATGAVAEELKKNKQALFAVFSDRVKKAEAAKAAAKKDVQTRYEAHLRQADEQAEKLYQDGWSRRDNLYQLLVKTARTSSDAVDLSNTADRLEELGDYQDSRNMAEFCRRRAVEVLAQMEAERDRKRDLDRQQQAIANQRERKRLRRKSLITAVVLIAICSFSAHWFFVTVPNNKYNDAVALMNEGKYLEAIDAFAELDDYKDSFDLLNDCVSSLTEKGEPGVRQRELAKAAITVRKLGNYQSTHDTSIELWKQSGRIISIDTHSGHIVGLKNDGTVVAVGNNTSGQCEVSGWNDIVAISAGPYHTVGLKANGTAVAVGHNKRNGQLSKWGKCDVSKWKDIVAISGDYDHTAGLKADGTVVAVGDNRYGQCDVPKWKNITAISTGSCYTVGLKTNGTVVAVGENDWGQCNVSEWTDIVAISAGQNHTVGLKADGTVVAVGYDTQDQCDMDMSEWTDIIAISAGYYHTVGLKADGTVVAVGSNNHGECNVSEWTDIVAIRAGAGLTVGLKTDGTIVAVGDIDDDTQSNMSNWTDIMIP